MSFQVKTLQTNTDIDARDHTMIMFIYLRAGHYSHVLSHFDALHTNNVKATSKHYNLALAANAAMGNHKVVLGLWREFCGIYPRLAYLNFDGYSMVIEACWECGDLSQAEKCYSLLTEKLAGSIVVADRVITETMIRVYGSAGDIAKGVDL